MLPEFCALNALIVLVDLQLVLLIEMTIFYMYLTVHLVPVHVHVHFVVLHSACRSHYDTILYMYLLYVKFYSNKFYVGAVARWSLV